MGAEAHFSVINREVRHASSKLEKWFSRVAITAVLLLSVRYRLLG